MHGDFKTPGGKLVQVDFDFEDERLRNVEVSGDFFLYPEEAITKITAAVEGSPADMGMADRATPIAVPSTPAWNGSAHRRMRWPRRSSVRCSPLWNL